MSAYASLYRKAVREAERAELAQALGKIDRATHVVLGRRRSDAETIYWYGAADDCADFVRGIERDVQIAPATADHKERIATDKVRVYRETSRHGLW